MSNVWNIPIIHQDEEWLVVNKPAGLSVHNSEDTDNVLSVLSKDMARSLYPVHRIDKPTSGLLILSCQPKMTTKLQQALQHATKTYWAIVRGVPSVAEGHWNQSISNKAEGRSNPRGQQRVSAQTQYRIMSSNRYLARIECTITTGRQHQIRKHCAINKHEIIGDTRYGDRRYQHKMSERFGDLDLYLQAQSLKITVDQQTFFFEAPPIENWSRLGVL